MSSSRKKEGPRPIETARGAGLSPRRLRPLLHAAWPFGIAGAALGATTVVAVANASPESCPHDQGFSFKRWFIDPISPPRTAGDMMPVSPLVPMPNGTATVEPIRDPVPLGGAIAPVQPTATAAPNDTSAPHVRPPLKFPEPKKCATSCDVGDPLCTCP